MQDDNDVQSGYEYDLRHAEVMLLAAGTGGTNDPVVLAQALRDYFAAHRNYTQGAMVPMFVQMVERALDNKLTPVVVGIGGLQQGVTLLNSEFHKISEIVNQLVSDMAESKQDRKSWHAKVDLLQTAFDRLQAAFDQLQYDFALYQAGSKRDQLDTMQKQLEEMRSKFSDNA